MTLFVHESRGLHSILPCMELKSYFKIRMEITLSLTVH